MKLGIVGLGNWGSRVAREAVQLLEEGRIDDLFLCDTDKGRLKQFSKYKGIQDYEDLLKKVDCVHICTPNKYHYHLGKKAIENHVHVLLEKPLTLKHFDAYDLLEKAMERGIVLKVGHIFRFANVVRKMKEMYKQNYFGRVFHINLEWTHYMSSNTQTNVLWDLLPHPLDILNFVTGQWPIELKGIIKNVRSKDIQDMAILQAFFDSELTANIHISWVNPIKRRRVEIIGTEKTAIVECVKQTLKIFDNKGNIESIPIESNNTIKEELLNFIESVSNGKNNNNSGIIGLRAVELIEKTINGSD